MRLLSLEPESSASAYSATSAYRIIFYSVTIIPNTPLKIKCFLYLVKKAANTKIGEYNENSK